MLDNSSASLAPAVFLDRDGVVNPMVTNPRTGLLDSPHRPEEASVLPGVPESILALQRAGFRVILASNQPSVARGKCTLEELRLVHERLIELLANAGARLDGVYYCHHDPKGVLPELACPCVCRKPAPGMLRRAAREHGLSLPDSFMVGDREKDVECGRNAGCRTVLANASPRESRAAADHDAKDLADATSWILSQPRTARA
ncbi:HAD family hydrolase [bacterium]|nr:HAD family hydrolase [bacterium]